MLNSCLVRMRQDGVSMVGSKTDEGLINGALSDGYVAISTANVLLGLQQS